MMYFNLMMRRENGLDSIYVHYAYIRVPEDCIYTREDTSLLGSGFVTHRLNEKGRKYCQEKYSKTLPGWDINYCDYTLRPVNEDVIINDAIYKIESIISSCENLAMMIDDTKEIDESIAALRKCIKKLVEQKHKIQ